MSNIVDNIENMNKKTKMILSVVGVCAVIVPALLLWYVSSHSRLEPLINKNKRPVGAASVQITTQNRPVSTPFIVAATPISKTATSSAVTKQGTSSAH